MSGFPHKFPQIGIIKWVSIQGGDHRPCIKALYIYGCDNHLSFHANYVMSKPQQCQSFQFQAVLNHSTQTTFYLLIVKTIHDTYSQISLNEYVRVHERARERELGRHRDVGGGAGGGSSFIIHEMGGQSAERPWHRQKLYYWDVHSALPLQITAIWLTKETKLTDWPPRILSVYGTNWTLELWRNSMHWSVMEMMGKRETSWYSTWRIVLMKGNADVMS